MQFPEPLVAIVYDVDPQMAIVVRSEAFSNFANNSELVAAPHMPFPSVGRIRKAQKGYDWVPINYSNRKLTKKK